MRRLVLTRPRIIRHSNDFVKQRRTISYMNERNFWNVGLSSLAGFWLHLTNENVREKFQSFVDQKLINQDVLTQNWGGRVQMFALLHGLMNPLLHKYQYDAKEFANAVGPALEIYHETLLQLMAEATAVSIVKAEPKSISDVTEIIDKVKQDILTLKKEDDEEYDNDSLEQSHSWRMEAKRDPKSLAGRFINMVTDENLNEQYHNAKMIKIFSQMGIPAPMNYVTGSCVVEYVSLLNIKAIEIDDTLYEQNEHPKFAASSNDDAVLNLPVLARVQVLYKLSRQFQKRNKNKIMKNPQINSSPTSASESYKSINTDVTASPPSTTDTSTGTDTDVTITATDTEKENSIRSEKIGTTSTTNSSNGPNHDPEIYSETRFGVAMFEGWLNGGSVGGHLTNTRPTKPQLRWKVASATESNHFW